MMLTHSIVALALTLASPVVPQKGLEGNWQGFLHPNAAIEIRVSLKVEAKPDGKLTGRAETPEVKSQPPVVFDEVTLDSDKVALISKADGREFRGTFDDQKGELRGDWKNRNGSTPVVFSRVDGPVTPAEVWEGAMQVQAGLKLRLAFHVLKLKGEPIRATMDSPDQSAYSIKVTTAEVGPDSLKFAIKNVGEFEGKIDEAGSQAVGQWKQGGVSRPLTLKKVAEATEVRRPQTPKAPFPYVAEEVAYDSRAKGVRIAGTLTLPEGDGPFPAVLLITGSGSQDRDESILGHKPFLVLADDLTRRGVAVLRVDDRGVGGTTGNPAEATTMDFVEDVLGGVDFLKTRKKIDPKRIGLIGHSEGGLIAPIVATRTDDAAFIVLLAGPGVPGDRILATQLVAILKASGTDEAKIRSSAEVQGRLMAIVKDASDPKAAAEKLKAAYAEVLKTLPDDERKAIAATDPNGAQVASLATPWFRFFLNYDPRPTLAKLKCPILALNGVNDVQVPYKENLEAIDQAVRSGGNNRVTTHAFAGLNHLFQTSKTGAPSEYGTIEETFSPAVLNMIGEWVTQH